MKLRISEIHSQQQIHDSDKERLKNDRWVLYNPDLTLLWSQSQKWNVFIFGWKTIFLQKIIQFFVIWQVKFLKFIVFIYLVLNLMLPYSTYIYRVVFTYKTCQNIILFCLENGLFLYTGIFWEMHLLLSHRYQGIVILWKWRTYSKQFKWKQHLLCSVISYQVLTHTKRGPSDSGSLTWVFLKPLIYMYLLKTDHALVSPWWNHFCPQSSIWSKFKYGPSTGLYQGSRPIGFKPGDFVCFNL